MIKKIAISSPHEWRLPTFVGFRWRKSNFALSYFSPQKLLKILRGNEKRDEFSSVLWTNLNHGTYMGWFWDSDFSPCLSFCFHVWGNVDCFLAQHCWTPSKDKILVLIWWSFLDVKLCIMLCDINYNLPISLIFANGRTTNTEWRKEICATRTI